MNNASTTTGSCPHFISTTGSSTLLNGDHHHLHWNFPMKIPSQRLEDLDFSVNNFLKISSEDVVESTSLHPSHPLQMFDHMLQRNRFSFLPLLEETFDGNSKRIRDPGIEETLGKNALFEVVVYSFVYSLGYCHDALPQQKYVSDDKHGSSSVEYYDTGWKYFSLEKGAVQHLQVLQYGNNAYELRAIYCEPRSNWCSSPSYQNGQVSEFFTVNSSSGPLCNGINRVAAVQGENVFVAMQCLGASHNTQVVLLNFLRVIHSAAKVYFVVNRTPKALHQILYASDCNVGYASLCYALQCSIDTNNGCAVLQLQCSYKVEVQTLPQVLHASVSSLPFAVMLYFPTLYCGNSVSLVFVSSVFARLNSIKFSLLGMAVCIHFFGYSIFAWVLEFLIDMAVDRFSFWYVTENYVCSVLRYFLSCLAQGVPSNMTICIVHTGYVHLQICMVYLHDSLDVITFSNAAPTFQVFAQPHNMQHTFVPTAFTVVTLEYVDITRMQKLITWLFDPGIFFSWLVNSRCRVVDVILMKRHIKFWMTLGLVGDQIFLGLGVVCTLITKALVLAADCVLVVCFDLLFQNFQVFILVSWCNSTLVLMLENFQDSVRVPVSFYDVEWIRYGMFISGAFVECSLFSRFFATKIDKWTDTLTDQKIAWTATTVLWRHCYCLVFVGNGGQVQLYHTQSSECMISALTHKKTLLAGYATAVLTTSHGWVNYMYYLWHVLSIMLISAVHKLEYRMTVTIVLYMFLGSECCLLANVSVFSLFLLDRAASCGAPVYMQSSVFTWVLDKSVVLLHCIKATSILLFKFTEYWKNGQNGLITMKESYSCYRERRTEEKWMQNLWKKYIPPRISFFFWRVMNRCLQTDENKV